MCGELILATTFPQPVGCKWVYSLCRLLSLPHPPTYLLHKQRLLSMNMASPLLGTKSYLENLSPPVCVPHLNCCKPGFPFGLLVTSSPLGEMCLDGSFGTYSPGWGFSLLFPPIPLFGLQFGSFLICFCGGLSFRCLLLSSKIGFSPCFSFFFLNDFEEMKY